MDEKTEKCIVKHNKADVFVVIFTRFFTFSLLQNILSPNDAVVETKVKIGLLLKSSTLVMS